MSKSSSNYGKLYLAYGSNLNANQMHLRCPNSKPIGATLLADHELAFDGIGPNGYANIHPKAGEKVPVLLWKLDPKDEPRLDYFEGYPDHYTKQTLIVPWKGRTVYAMAYIMNPRCVPTFPSHQYFDVVKRGYEENDFDPSILTAALVRTAQNFGPTTPLRHDIQFQL